MLPKKRGESFAVTASRGLQQLLVGIGGRFLSVHAPILAHVQPIAARPRIFAEFLRESFGPPLAPMERKDFGHGNKVAKGKHTMILHTVAFAAGGAVLGFGYYKLVGCSSGACPITSNPYISSLFGAVMGFLAGGGMGK
jgi:hypothetical protein